MIVIVSELVIFFSEKTFCIIVGGGYGNGNIYSTLEVLTGDLGRLQLPNLPEDISGSSMVKHNGNILVCGGLRNPKQCLKLDHGNWKEHSTLNDTRIMHSVVTTKHTTFIFGGFYSSRTYEYLQKESNTWLTGNNKIPGGYYSGCAIAVKSEQEIWLIGGFGTEKRILSFNTNDHTFQELPFQLNVGRVSARCAYIPNTTRIIVTGGSNSTFSHLDCTEIIDTDKRVSLTASPMNHKRVGHGIGVVNINGKERVAIFGGSYEFCHNLDSVELYNTETGKWEKTDIKLNEPKIDFGFLTVRLSDIISKP